jgi:KDO2-lipid IV(A) lauroyltransferase
MSRDDDLSFARFWHPRYWPTWLLWLGLKALAKVPFERQLPLGRGLGPWLARLKQREARYARTNLAVCFPELDDAEREQLLARHFEAIGLSFVEMANGWFAPLATLRKLVRVEGKAHFDAALAKGRGVLLVSAHFTPLETCVAILEDMSRRPHCLYRPQRNAMMDAMIRRGRSRFAASQIPRDNVRELLRRLRRGDVVVYMPDQTYLGNQSALLPFFGETAVTNVATSKLARIGGATLLPYCFHRRRDDRGYVVRFGAPLDGFPTDDEAADTQRLVTLLEAHIHKVPEQYLWLYKKFKARPAPLPDLYAR